MKDWGFIEWIAFLWISFCIGGWLYYNISAFIDAFG